MVGTRKKIINTATVINKDINAPYFMENITPVGNGGGSGGGGGGDGGNTGTIPSWVQGELVVDFWLQSENLWYAQLYDVVGDFPNQSYIEIVGKNILWSWNLIPDTDSTTVLAPPTSPVSSSVYVPVFIQSIFPQWRLDGTITASIDGYNAVLPVNIGDR